METEQGYTKLRVLAVPFGSESRKDFHGEYFTPNTEFGINALGGEHVVYACFDHLRTDNPLLKSDPQNLVIGRARFLEKTEEGLFYEIEVAKAHKYYNAIIELAKQGYLGVSTGALPNSKIVKDDGEILQWLIGEVSVTVKPANIDTVNRTELVKALHELGIVDDKEEIAMTDAKDTVLEEASATTTQREEEKQGKDDVLNTFVDALTSAIKQITGDDNDEKPEQPVSASDTSTKSETDSKDEADVEVDVAVEDALNKAVDSLTQAAVEEPSVDTDTLVKSINTLESRVEALTKELEEIRKQNDALREQAQNELAKNVTIDVLTRLAEATRNRAYASAATKLSLETKSEDAAQNDAKNTDVVEQGGGLRVYIP